MGWGLTAELQPIHMHRGFDENAIKQCYLLQGRCRSQEHRTSECKYGRKDLHPFDSFGANARCSLPSEHGKAKKRFSYQESSLDF